MSSSSRFEWLSSFPDVEALAVVAVVGVVVVLFIAIEVAILLAVGIILAVARLGFGQPWVIEVSEPDTSPVFFRTKGLRNTRALHGQIRMAIENGTFSQAQVEFAIYSQASLNPS